MGHVHRYTVSIPTETRALKALRAFLDGVFDASACPDAERLVLAIDEACSNVIKYRCDTIDDGQVTVTIERGERVLRVRIGQFCRADDVDKIKPRDLADVRPGGLGTSFIQQIMDRVLYQEEPSAPGCVALVLEKDLSDDCSP